MILIPATVASIRSRKDKSLSVSFDTGEVSPETAGALYAMQNSAVYLAVKETEFTAPETGQLSELDTTFVDDKKKTASQRLRAVLYRLWQQEPEGYEKFETFYASKMEQVIGHFRGKLG